MRAQGLAKQNLSKGLVGLILLATFLLWISPAYGWSIVETFDNGDYNHTLFTFINYYPDKITPALVSEQLQITISEYIPAPLLPFMGGLKKLSYLVEYVDFDIQVDFDLVDWPASSNVGAGIILSGIMEIRRVSSINSPHEYYECRRLLGGGVAITPEVTDTSGKLRLRRTDCTVQAFYWQNGAWQSPPGFSVTDPNSMYEPTFLYIALVSDISNVAFKKPPLTVAFDNLKIIRPGSPAELLLLLE
jgi:hypothetical protein